MASDGGGSAHDLVVTTWVMYSIAMLLFVVRLYVSDADSVFLVGNC